MPKKIKTKLKVVAKKPEHVPETVAKHVENVMVESVKEAVETVAIPERIVKEAAKKNVTYDDMKQFLKAAVEEMMPAVAAIVASNQQSPRNAAAEKMKKWQSCNVCLQKGPATKDNPYGAPCRNNHIGMVVYPTNQPQFGKWFQGIFINGVRYLSDNRRDRVMIPADCEGTLKAFIENWERNEMEMRLGKVVEHDSGGIREGRGTAGFKAAVGVGFR